MAEETVAQKPFNSIDIAGRRFGRLVAIEATRERFGNYSVGWLCKCDCGNEKVIGCGRLTLGRTRSCGCLRRDIITTHGATRDRGQTTEYTIWRGIKQRCLSPNYATYSDYGARGITICERWLSFENFVADMGSRPHGHSVERVDNEKSYSPDNCIWKLSSLQAQNRRSNRTITFNGETLCIAEWSRRTGIPGYCIIARLKRHWSHEKALTTQIPARKSAR
jgi:hypothetical protein